MNFDKQMNNALITLKSIGVKQYREVAVHSYKSFKDAKENNMHFEHFALAITNNTFQKVNDWNISQDENYIIMCKRLSNKVVLVEVTL